MSRSQHKVSVLIRDEISVFDSSDAAVTGLVNGDFTKYLSKDGANDATAVTVTEIANGRYTVTFTPGSTGVWVLDVRHATHNKRGWRSVYDVTTEGPFSGTPQTGDCFARLGAPVGASVSDDIASLDTQVGNIGLTTSSISLNVDDVRDRLPAALVGGRMDASVGAVAANALTAAALAADAVAEIQSGLATSAEISALAIPTANENADALLDRADAIATGVTLRGHLRVADAHVAGKSSGFVAGAVSAAVVRNAGDSKDVVTATVDANGNRTAVTVDRT